MHEQTRRPGLSGTVLVDTSGETGATRFKAAIAALRGAGWIVSDGLPEAPGHIGLLAETSQPAAETSPPVIVACDSSTRADCPPDPYAILSALGGTRLEQTLAASVREGHSTDQVLVGFNWTLVKAGPLCGIARSPARGTEGARSIRPEEGFLGKDLRELAGYLESLDPLSRSLGLAAVNCYWNRRDPMPQTAPLRRSGGGLQGIEAPGYDALIIGGFRDAQKRLTKARIVEREPAPGDLSVDQAPEAYKTAHTLAITAQTLMNGSLTPILEASAMVPNRILVGPSAPGCPALFDHGIDEIAAEAIVGPDAAERFILETGTMIMREEIARSFWLRPRD